MYNQKEKQTLKFGLLVKHLELKKPELAVLLLEVVDRFLMECSMKWESKGTSVTSIMSSESDQEQMTLVYTIRIRAKGAQHKSC